MYVDFQFFALCFFSLHFTAILTFRAFVIVKTNYFLVFRPYLFDDKITPHHNIDVQVLWMSDPFEVHVILSSL